MLRFDSNLLRYALPAILALSLVVGVQSVFADDSGKPIHQVIDEMIAAGWKARNVTPAPPADDAEFLRRIYLDLTGTIPTADVARAFLDDPTADKRAKLIDKLLASPEYARHMQLVFDVVLLERQYGNYVTDAEWQEYLRESFAANKPWDQLVRELVGADGTDPKIRSAIKFYTVRTIDSYRVLNPPHITRDIGRLFLGVNLQCAQCHDHPSISDYKQADYQGVRAFIDRLHFFSGKADGKDAMMIAEKAEGNVKFTSVFDSAKVEHLATPHLPGGKAIADPTFEKGKEYTVAPANGVMPVPAYSRRAQLAAALAAADNSLFNRNIANRLWEQMLGRGIVHPVELHSETNPPSHPELLKVLADRFAASKFDIKNFLREIALSKTYQLSSSAGERPAADANSPAKSLPPEAFAMATLRPLRPAELAFAIFEATGWTEGARKSLGAKLTEPELFKHQSAALKPFIDLFGRPAGQPEATYESSLFQALYLGNGDALVDRLSAADHTRVGRSLKLTTESAVAEELYLGIFSRRPSTEEVALVAEFLKDRTKDRQAALQELVWGMIASTEFRFNH